MVYGHVMRVSPKVFVFGFFDFNSSPGDGHEISQVSACGCISIWV